MHINDDFARTTPFGGRIAHGFLTASVISAAVANRLPQGPGTVYISQAMNFRAPVRPARPCRRAWWCARSIATARG